MEVLREVPLDKVVETMRERIQVLSLLLSAFLSSCRFDSSSLCPDLFPFLSPVAALFLSRCGPIPLPLRQLSATSASLSFRSVGGGPARVACSGVFVWGGRGGPPSDVSNLSVAS